MNHFLHFFSYQHMDSCATAIIIRDIDVMSEISKARERIMLSKRLQQTQRQERGSLPSQRQPRKFTVSSLTHNIESKLTEMEHGPATLRTKTPRKHAPETPKDARSSQQFESRAKENTPLMLKTVNVKISNISRLELPSSVHHLDSQVAHEESHYFESPPKVTHTRLLHKDKRQLMVAPPQVRRHHSPYKPAQCLLEYADAYIAQQKASGRSFVDSLFPPERTIIFNKKILSQQEGLKFQRLSRIYHNDINIVNTCEPTYISKGKYTNPYLYSALTILAEEPSCILQLFGDQEGNESGIYRVNLCRDGVWRYVIVDDFVPVKATINHKYLFFLRSKQIEGNVEIWPALVQKAIAKTYGTYLDLASLKSQGMTDIFRVLTGAPAHTYLLNKDFRSYLILIDAALKRKHVVTLEMIPEQHQESANLKKLALNHAYRVIQIKKSGLRIRNYAEAELVTKLAFEQCLIFSKLVIYRIEPNYRYITHKLRHKKYYFSKVLLTVPAKTRGYLEVWQNNPAYYKKYIGSQIDYQLAKVMMWLQEEGQGEWVQSGKEIQLNQGQYELHIHLCQQREYDFTLSYYGEKEVTIQRLKNMQEWYEHCLCIPKGK